MDKRIRTFYKRFKIDIAFFVSLTALILSTIMAIFFFHFHLNCQDLALPSATNHTHISFPIAQSGISSGACIDVEGTVLGDIVSGSNISLFKTSNTSYRVVMNEIRAKKPSTMGVVNESSGFKFSCLLPGNYAFVIPASSYKGSVGSPLPYEFDCKNFSLEIAFQGGDCQYAVGAFSIINTSAQNKSVCNESIEIGRAERGSLYKECPLD